MRPRQVCRGKVGAAARSQPPCSASMRPRQVCRGKWGWRYVTVGFVWACFNEAPASLPGKGRRFGSGPDPGAGASMRPRQVCRGKQDPAAIVGRRRLASMRPRQVCRGKRTSRPSPASTGGCFNEAPASLPGKGSGGGRGYDTGGRASMRPRQVCRGKWKRALTAPVEGSVASMRPRQVCRGKPGGGPPRGGRLGPASMRPRQVCRGKASSRRSWSTSTRRFNEAPASLPGKASLHGSSLNLLLRLQ